MHADWRTGMFQARPPLVVIGLINADD